jgi:hypothetical protein
VGALSHYLERSGVPTAHISLIREQTAAIRPPRALWVPFMLGRPLGAPNEPDFQRRVLRHLLSLFERPGPVLDDFPEDAPGGSGEAAAFVCPVSFASAKSREAGLAGAVLEEIAELGPWYELARRRRGRTTVGVFGAGVEAAARHVVSYLKGTPEAPANPAWSAGMAVKRACDDLKAYYYEAVSAQPGNQDAQAIERWFWSETAAARALLAIRDLCLKSDDESLKPLGKLSLIPRFVADLHQRNT